MAKNLSQTERHEALKHLPGWKETEDGKALTKTYAFASFSHAFAFMTHVALYAEKVNHHPEWTNIYNKVHVVLTTHTNGGVSAKDISFALEMEEVAFGYINPCTMDQSDLVF
jgi:4a-hydroxytetrahydrobiopterin dehydratase